MPQEPKGFFTRRNMTRMNKGFSSYSADSWVAYICSRASAASGAQDAAYYRPCSRPISCGPRGEVPCNSILVVRMFSSHKTVPVCHVQTKMHFRMSVMHIMMAHGVQSVRRLHIFGTLVSHPACPQSYESLQGGDKWGNLISSMTT